MPPLVQIVGVVAKTYSLRYNFDAQKDYKTRIFPLLVKEQRSLAECLIGVGHDITLYTK